MSTSVTYIEVQPSFAHDAVRRMEEYRRDSREEDGNSGVHLLQEMHRQNRFVIIEVWDSEASFAAHDAAARTVEFRSRLRELHNSPYDQRVHHNLVAPAKKRTAYPGSLCVVTHVDVPPPRKDETEVLLKSVAEDSRQDERTLAYDVLQQNAPRLNHFTIVSFWNNSPAFESYAAGPRIRQFREALGPMLGALYDERLYRNLTNGRA